MRAGRKRKFGGESKRRKSTSKGRKPDTIGMTDERASKYEIVMGKKPDGDSDSSVLDVLQYRGLIDEYMADAGRQYYNLYWGRLFEFGSITSSTFVGAGNGAIGMPKNFHEDRAIEAELLFKSKDALLGGVGSPVRMAVHAVCLDDTYPDWLKGYLICKADHVTFEYTRKQKEEKENLVDGLKRLL